MPTRSFQAPRFSHAARAGVVRETILRFGTQRRRVLAARVASTRRRAAVRYGLIGKMNVLQFAYTSRACGPIHSAADQMVPSGAATEAE